jgi:acyl carrier protein phosphodiesterase
VNYLAHAFLSDGSPESILGGLLGDFVKGPLDGRYPRAVTEAIALHRRVDTFTDSHPQVRDSRARISAGRRRYAGVMVDVFYDHFLARHFRDYTDEPLERFAQRIYAVLLNGRDLPGRLARALPSMVRWDWLTSYRNIGAVHAALDRISRRNPRHGALAGAGHELALRYAELEADFRSFFPDAVRFAAVQKSGAGASYTSVPSQ